MQIPVEWILAVLLGLGGVIATLAGIIYHSLSGRIAAQDKIIEKLQDDVDRMAKGCGIAPCLWKDRRPNE